MISAGRRGNDGDRSERVATSDSSGPGDEAVEGSWSPKRTRATSTKKDAKNGSGSTDPEVLAGEIEKTREELAETLDAIADRVSPKRVVDRTKTQAKADAQQAVATVKEASAHAAEVVKGKVATASASTKVKASAAAESVKSGVAQAKERVSGDDAVRSPLAPATSVEVGSAAPVSTAGALADATIVQTEPAGADAPAWTTLCFDRGHFTAYWYLCAVGRVEADDWERSGGDGTLQCRRRWIADSCV